MRIPLNALAVVALIAVSGCATPGGSTLIGAGAGATFGAGMGALVDAGPSGDGRIRNVFIGAAAGSLLGAGAGYLYQNELDAHEKQSYEKGKKDAESSGGTPAAPEGAPVLLPPKVEARFVEQQIRGNVFVPSHFEYVIVEPARWSR